MPYVYLAFIVGGGNRLRSCRPTSILIDDNKKNKADEQLKQKLQLQQNNKAQKQQIRESVSLLEQACRLLHNPCHSCNKQNNNTP